MVVIVKILGSGARLPVFTAWLHCFWLSHVSQVLKAFDEDNNSKN